MVEVKYARLWSKVYDVLTEARKRVESIVEDVCRMVYADIGGKLEELADRYGFTYVIEPLQEGSNGGSIVPCVFIEAPKKVVKAVAKEISKAFPEVVSEARLRFEQKPKMPKIV